MSLESITIENSVESWSGLRTLGYVLFSYFFAFFGFIFLFVGIVPEPTEIHSILLLSFSLAYAIIMSLRNRIIKKLFLRMAPAKFLEFNYILDKIFFITSVIMFLLLFLLFIVPTEIYDVTLIVSLSSFFYCLYAPIFCFGRAITPLGEIRIAFEALFSNINNFNQRQKWLERIFRKLEKELKKGNIKVSSEKLVYYCNVKLMKSEDIKNNLRDIERWMLREQTESIVNSIKQIIPEEEIKPIEKISLLDRFFQIPSDVRKYLFLAIIVVIIVLLKPEWIEKLIDKIL